MCEINDENLVVKHASCSKFMEKDRKIKKLADKLLKIDYSNLAGWKTQDEVQGVVRELLEMDDEKEKKQVDLTPRPLRIKFGI
ncbi:hypothetical protein AUK11_00465 [bacterium CG2_30_37_16]|nr:MAG: hypothetical protein AUK11_00465 [bacterium CG2_30_37_16]PIP30392.1 MAG: hypothetical protein COX25_04865 [bacterium (Candidatus Howlettbacteria) CG23_combo_of_CG06-09_8_20_14_all_37_9]PIX98903.1 MAG: hypothetical protein COZ22_03910 [bacterium (Candidatus Howlettbacteria) CG_4_10_14_3_um_filter_37_10]PJB05877.1 MAG: hypothetical protein CO123_03135 [bacterium (Candidatus Howlettbacteria) CG_4_9_14_3_um_filter_37_10]